ncbi:hypothetical protein CPD4_20 [Clostridium phage CPD4]|nr:hypothetical protein CPD4_20 [Clostridium phage CPD4]
MPSTSKTPTLGLNKWELTDKPKMNDFNKDNENIENFATEHKQKMTEVEKKSKSNEDRLDALRVGTINRLEWYNSESYTGPGNITPITDTPTKRRGFKWSGMSTGPQTLEIKTLPIEPNSDYILAFLEDIEGSFTSYEIKLAYTNGGQQYKSIVKQGSTPQSNGYKLKTHKFSIPSGATDTKIQFVVQGATSSTSLKVLNILLARGNVVPDYNLAPEDILKRLDLLFEKDDNLQAQIHQKAAQTDVLLKVNVPLDRDCNTFKQVNAFFSFDTGSGDFKNTPDGTLAQGSSRVFTVRNYGYSEGRFQQEFINIYPANNITRYIRNYIYESNSWSKWYKVYDEANKPTPKELGAYPTPKNAITDFNLALTEGQYLISGELPNAPITGVRYGILVIYVSDQDKHNNSNNWIWQEYYDTSGNKYWRYKVNDKDWFPWRKDYNSGAKPTPADIGAWDKTAKRLEGVDLNTITEGGIYSTVRNSVDRNAPILADGRLIVLSWNTGHWASQMFFADGGRVFTRTATNLEGTGWTNWAEIYSKQNKPTPADIGALPTTGGELSGHLIMRPGQKFIGAHNYGFSCRTKEGSDDYVMYIDADNKVHIGYAGRPVKIDSLDIVNKNNKKIYHEDNKPTLDDLGASGKGLCLDNRQPFEVGGEANKYYPVVIKAGELKSTGVYGLIKLSISRGYASKAPDSWNTSTHKGGLTLTILTSGDCYWGGNDPNLEVLRFDQKYSTMVAGMRLSTRGIVVWLRGGGAQYYLTSDYGAASTATVELEGFTDSAEQVFGIRTDDSQVNSEIVSKYKLRTSGLYDEGERVYSPHNKPSLSDLGAASSNHNHDSAYLGKTATAANSNKLANMGIYDYESGTQGIPSVGNDGVMEIGQILDFHLKGSNKDYDMRITTRDGSLEVDKALSAENLWARKYLRINDWYGGAEDGRLWFKQENKKLYTENVTDFVVNDRSIAKGDYWDNDNGNVRVCHLGGGLRLVRQIVKTGYANSGGGVSYTIHFPKAWNWVLPISLVSHNYNDASNNTSGYCTIDHWTNSYLNGGCYQMVAGKPTQIILTYLATE